MKTAAKLVFAVLTVSIMCTASVTAQKRRTVVVRPKPEVVTTNTLSNNATSSDAQKVSNQVMNVTKFLYILGGIAKGIEDIDNDPKANRGARDMNATNKANVIQSLRSLRTGLNALESDFRTKPLLRRFLLKIEGISALGAQAEELAAAGRFGESGRPLVMVVEKLSDTLVAMP